MKSKPNIRFAEIEDLPQVMSIFNQAIRAKVCGVLKEVTLEDRLDWFNSFDQNSYPIYVAELDDKILGYCYLSPYRSGRQAMASIAEISYYIDYKAHRNGIASELVQYAIDDCDRLGKQSLLAVLLDINIPSIQLLEKFNFSLWGHYPSIIDLDGQQCSQLIYGLKL